MDLKKNTQYFSLFIIVSYWIYQLLNIKTDPILPVSFSEFAYRILITKSVQLAAIALLLYIGKESWAGMGFRLKNFKKQILFGLLGGLIMFLIFNVGLSGILNSVFPKPVDSPGIFKYFKEPANLYIWLLIGIFGGGIVEELMRIFFLTRFEITFNQTGLYIALVISSILFGLGHLYQGTGTAISTGLEGLILGVIYIKRRSAIEVITIHAFSDILAILGAFKMANA